MEVMEDQSNMAGGGGVALTTLQYNALLYALMTVAQLAGLTDSSAVYQAGRAPDRARALEC